MTLLADGRVLASGGADSGNTFSTSCEIYDPVANTWTLTGSLHDGRYAHTATLLPSGKVLVAGGYNSVSFSNVGEIYDPATGVWTLTPPMNIGRSNLRTVLMPNGRVLVVGGVVMGGVGGFTPTAEVYDPIGNTWTFTGSMTFPREAFTLTVLNTGNVLAAGGYNATGPGPITSAEVYNPSTAVWTSTSQNMNVPRYYSTGTRLTNGDVVLSSGGSSSGDTFTSERYSSGVAVTPFINIIAGNAQSTTVNTPVAVAPSVQVVYQNGNNVGAGYVVNFAVTGGSGSITGNVAITNSFGIATLGTWKLGMIAGSNSLSVTSAGVTSASITATGTPGPVSTVNFTAGTGQNATVNTNVATPPAVTVKDSFGNVIPGAPVTFSITAGGGSITGGSAAANASGVATVGSWMLGTTSGTNTLKAISNGVFTTVNATGTPGSPTTISVTNGNNQSVTVNTSVPIVPVVLVRDSFGNNVANGTPVTFSVATGGGSVVGGSTTTNAGGASITSWTLGTVAGSNSLSVTSGAAPAATVNATGTPDVPKLITIVAGNGQTATVNTTVAIAPAVNIKDMYGNLVPSASVTFAVATGAGTVTGGNATANSSGVATLGNWFLGTAAGSNSLSVNSGSAPTINFNATGTAGAPTSVSVFAGDGQTATVNTNVAIAPAVLVKDQFNNPVPNRNETFVITSGSGVVAGSPAMTNASGIATLSNWKLGTVAGANSLKVTDGGSATINATATAGAPNNVAVNTGDNQTATVNTAVAIQPSVIVIDMFGNVVPNTPVTFTVATGGGFVVGGSVNTNASGIATCGSWTLGTVAGANSLVAMAGAGPSATFNATATAGAAAQIIVVSGNNQSATVNTNVAAAPTVQVLDQYNNPVIGVTATFAVSSGGGSLTFATPATNTGGMASVGSWTLGTVAGSNTLSVTSGAAPAAAFNATATAGAVTQISINTGNNQSATVNTNVAVSPSVLVQDQFNNPVPGALVTFTVTNGGGSTTVNTPISDASGIATLGSWTLGQIVGTNSLSAKSGASPTIAITATSTPGAAAQIVVNTGDNQTATVNTNVPVAPSVLVLDQFGNTVPGTPVLFTVSAGGGSVTGANPSTDAGGLATLGSWTLGPAAIVNSLTITSGTAPSAGVNATATAGAAAQIIVKTGDNQSATVNNTVPISPSVQILDATNNIVANAPVSFAVASGGGSITGATTTSNSSGIATVGTWTLGKTAGANTLTVTSGAAAPATVSATGTPDIAATITITAGNNQTAEPGSVVAIAPAVALTDKFANPVVAGTPVTFTVASGGGSVTGGNAVTDATGAATLGSWKLGTSTGFNTLAVTSGTATAAKFMANAANDTPVIDDFSTNDNPGLLNSVVTYVLSASDGDTPVLNYSIDFGDGTPLVFGTFAESTTVATSHTFVAAGNFVVRATVTDGGTTDTRTITENIPAPPSDADGLKNISDNLFAVTNPNNNLSIEITDSNGGIIQLGIDTGDLGLARASLDVSTDFGDISGRTQKVGGTRPVHQYSTHGIYIAKTTVSEQTSKSQIGIGRKTIVISARETGEKLPSIIKGGATADAVGLSPSKDIIVRSLQGKFNFSGNVKDTVSFSGLIQLPSGLDTTQPHEFSVAIGNVVTSTTIDSKGAGGLPGSTPILRNLKISYPHLKKGALTKGGESARIDVTISTAGLVTAGFDTEGIIKNATLTKGTMVAPRSIQIGMLLDGVPYEALTPTSFQASSNNDFGTISGRSSK